MRNRQILFEVLNHFSMMTAVIKLLLIFFEMLSITAKDIQKIRILSQKTYTQNQSRIKENVYFC